MTEITCNRKCCIWNMVLTCQKGKVQLFDTKCYSYEMYVGDDTKKTQERDIRRTSGTDSD